MRGDRFFAMRTGVHRLPDGQPARFEKYELGSLRVGSGKLALSDPIFLQNTGVVTIPAGDYDVVATIAHVPESYDYGLTRPAYLSLVLSGEPTDSIAPVKFDEDFSESGVHAVPAIAGIPDLRGISTSQMSSVSMVDAEAIGPGLPVNPGTWCDTVISPGDGTGWFERMDTENDGPLGTLLTKLPNVKDGENIAILIARPERIFPVVQTLDGQGRITGVHIDLLVIGELSEKLQAFDGQDEVALSDFSLAETRTDKTFGVQDRETARASTGVFSRLRNFFRG